LGGINQTPLGSIIIIIKSLINSAALKNSDALQAYHSVLRNRCAFRCRAKIADDNDERRRSVGRLFQMSGPETANFLRPTVVAVWLSVDFDSTAVRLLIKDR